MHMIVHANKQIKKTQNTTRDVTIIKKLGNNPTWKINHWWTQRTESERVVEWSKDTPTSTEGEATDVY